MRCRDKRDKSNVVDEQGSNVGRDWGDAAVFKRGRENVFYVDCLGEEGM